MQAGRGRRPYPLGVMLRVHCVQLFYNLSDPGMEDLLYEVESVRRFAGLRLSGPLPDETTILNFRHLLETQGLGMGLFEEINVHLASLGHRLKTGTIVDASIIDAPSSTKNRRGEQIRRCTRRRRETSGLRDEGAYRGGRRIGSGAQLGDDGRQRGGRDAGVRCCMVTRRRHGATRATRVWTSARRTGVAASPGRWR